MSEQPIVSVVLTTCDRPDLARRALASALSQNVPDWTVEAVVIDDGRAQPFPEVETPLVRVLRTGGYSGVTRARNRGLHAAKGKWATFLDDDDQLVDGGLRAAVEHAEQSQLPGPVAVVSWMEEVDATGTVTLVRRPRPSPRGGKWNLDDCTREERRGRAAFNTLIAPRDLLLAIGGWDEALDASEHTDLFLRLNAVASIDVSHRCAYRMTHHDSGPRLTQHHQARADGMAATWRRHRQTLREHPEAAAWYRGKHAAILLRAHRWPAAIRVAGDAFRLAPRRERALRQLVIAAGGPFLLSTLERGRSRAPATTTEERTVNHATATRY